MAHWIIKDKGSIGKYCTCSYCGASYWYDKIQKEAKCPNCGKTINKENNEYDYEG